MKPALTGLTVLFKEWRHARSNLPSDPAENIGARNVAQDGALLARLQLPLGRHDLPARQPAVARTAQTRTHQESPAGPLGLGPWAKLPAGASEPADQKNRSERDLLRPGGPPRDCHA